jgi:hypothetical protein
MDYKHIDKSCPILSDLIFIFFNNLRQMKIEVIKIATIETTSAVLRNAYAFIPCQKHPHIHHKQLLYAHFLQPHAITTYRHGLVLHQS